MAAIARQCTLCQCLSPSLLLHISHLRLVHSQDPSFHVSCDIDGCSDVFQTFSSFNSHVYRRHRVALGLEKAEALVVPPSPVPSNETQMSSLGGEHPHDEHCDGISYEPESHTTRETLPPSAHVDNIKANAGFVMKLSEGRQLSQLALGDVIKGCRSICQQTLSIVQERVLSALEDAGIDSSNLTGLDEALSSMPDPFEGIDSAHLREKFYREHFNYLVSIAMQNITYMQCVCNVTTMDVAIMQCKMAVIP